MQSMGKYMFFVSEESFHGLINVREIIKCKLSNKDISRKALT